MKRTRILLRRGGALVASVAIAAAIFAPGAVYAEVGGTYTVPVPDAPQLAVTYSDEISRTPDSLNKTYVLTQVRDVVLLFDGVADTDVFTTLGPSSDCTDPDVNLALGLIVGRNSHLDIHVDYEQWNDSTGVWESQSQLLADIKPGEGGGVSIPICAPAV